jgi:protein-S-isoprenylcysteine O-methyltransferase Ste14
VIPLYRSGGVGALFYLVIVLWLVSEISIGFRAVRRVGTRGEDRFSGPALATGMSLAVYLGTVFASSYPWAAMRAGRTTVFITGVVVALIGIAIRQFAVATLGRYFTTRVVTSPDQKVVDGGPYRYIRHPSYTGLLLVVLGLLLCSNNWLSLACFVLALPGFAYRIRVEEAALVGAIGQPYLAYMRRTKRLVPFLV